MNCDWKIFPGLLRKGWCEAVNPGDKITVDETLFSFFSQADKTSPPQVNIPRKPHPNGLLSNTASFYLDSGVPYVFDFEPEVRRGDKCNPRDALNAMLHRRPWDSVVPKVTIDSGFSGGEEFIVMKNLGFKFVAAVNMQHKKWLVELLDYHCPLNSTITVKDTNDLVWSFKKTQEKNILVVTNMFGSQVTPQNGPKLVEKEGEELLSKLGKPILAAIVKEMGIKYDDPTLPLEGIIARHLNENYSSHQDEVSSPSQLAQTTASNVIQQDDDDDESELLTKENLQGKSKKQLVDIAKKLKIRTSGRNKPQIIDSILQAQSVDDEEILRLRGKLGNSSKKDDEVHQYYKDNFNAIDIFDGYWYDIKTQHKIQSWTPKFIISLLEMGFVNSYAISKSYRNYQNFTSFVDGLVLKLLKRPLQ